MRQPTSYNFTLVLRPRDLREEEFVVSDDLLDQFFESGCDDAVFSHRGTELLAEFDREAASFSDAVMSAISQCELAAPNLWVMRVEPDDLVTASDIARRTHRSRQSVAQLVAGKRGPGSFPDSLGFIKGRTQVWRWSEVSLWFANHLNDPVSLDGAPQFAAAVNSALDIRHQVAMLSTIVSDSRSQGRDPTIEVSREALAELPAMVGKAAKAAGRQLALRRP